MPACTVISHWHWDHTFGLHAIHGTSLSSKKTHDKLLEVAKWNWTIGEMRQREKDGLDIPFCNDKSLIEYPELEEIKVVTTDEIIEKETILDLGGIELRILPGPMMLCMSIYMRKKP